MIQENDVESKVKELTLFGLEQANHDFTTSEAWGKNIFTNAVPVAIGQYLHLKAGLKAVEIQGYVNSQGDLVTRQVERSWDEIIGCDPEEAAFSFENQFEPYRPYTGEWLNSSDVVITDRHNGNPCRALEIKLTVVPDSTTSKLVHDDQSCEIVARPLMIEQLAISLARSYGKTRRAEIRNSIVQALWNPQQFRWNDRDYVQQNFHKIMNAARGILTGILEDQTPMVLHVIWRTDGTKPTLEENCFEVFVWTDVAFATMFYDQAISNSGRASEKLTRPQRTLVWLVKMLFDYTAQDTLDSLDTTDLAYGLQTDKAGAFAGRVTHRYLGGRYLSQPRLKASVVTDIISEQGLGYLAPERRLDAALYLQAAKDRAISSQ